MNLVDSHCHLDGEEFAADRDAVIGRALEAGVDCMLSIGTGNGPPDLEASIRVADRYPQVYATVGVHPHNAAKAGDSTLGELEALLRHPKVVALGEIGLDYHYDFSPRDRQRAVFEEQLDLAARAGKPVIIHTREAWDDTVAVLKRRWHGPGVMHCFGGSPEQAKQALGLGFHISFAGIVTFPKASNVHASAQAVPLDRLLVETDSPYLAPVPYRGKRNEPSFVVHTARRVAQLRGESYEAFAEATTSNFQRLFLAELKSRAG